MEGKKPNTSGTKLAIAAALVLGIAIGRIGDGTNRSVAQPKDAPKAFLSGGERSAILLQDISKTLKQIDKRVAGIEKQLQQLKQLKQQEKK